MSSQRVAQKQGPPRRSLAGRLGWLKKGAIPYWMLAPAFFLLLAFSVFPFVRAIHLSVTDTQWIGAPYEYVGFHNYATLAGDSGTQQFFQQAAINSLVWTVGVVGGQLLLGLITALVLNETFRGRTFFRTAVLVPIAIPSIMHILTWQWMYDPNYGLVNHYLRIIGIVEGPHGWIKQTNSSIWPLIVVGIWLGFPFMSLMLLSGLQGLQPEFYEAASIDGASAFQKLRYITLPQMRPIIVIAIILHTLWWWNHFDTLIILGTRSGFEFNATTATIPILAWFEAFRWSHLSRGAAISVFSMAVLAALMWWNARRELRSVRH